VESWTCGDLRQIQDAAKRKEASMRFQQRELYTVEVIYGGRVIVHGVDSVTEAEQVTRSLHASTGVVLDRAGNVVTRIVDVGRKSLATA
jgi:hypothetical protein